MLPRTVLGCPSAVGVCKFHRLLLQEVLYTCADVCFTVEDAITTQRGLLNWLLCGFLDLWRLSWCKKIIVGSRIPVFTNLELNQVKGSFDFVGANYYNSLYVKDDSRKLNKEVRSFDANMAINLISIQYDTSLLDYLIM